MADYKIIKGRFHVKGFQPDGDSIRFQADQPEHWNAFSLSSPGVLTVLKKQLRIEAIDAMETHYEGYHQPRPFALAALEYLLEMLEIKSVNYSLSVTQIISADDDKPGFIATSGLDKFGRPVCYIFPNGTDLVDGSTLTTDQLPIDDSINFILARAGLVYPTFYTTTDRTTAEKIRAVVARARRTRRGLWSIDRTPDFTIWDTRTIQEDILILPKLFRRLVSFFNGHGDFGKLKGYMENQRDNLVMWDGTTHRSLADLMTIEERRLRLNVPVEDILFKPQN